MPFIDPVRIEIPSAHSIPLVLDSPHSGTRYPSDFRATKPISALQTAEDTHVDALFSTAPSLGATFICAEFPRCYIDCNRRVDDIDPSLLASKWPEAIHPSEQTRLGYGLAWRLLDDGSEIYDRKLSVDELKARIENCYVPYWASLTHSIDSLYEKFGVVYHLNCHSMPARATHASHLPLGTPHADIVLGNRDGTTCDESLISCIEHVLRGEGLKVARNDPYKGVALVQAFGNPARGRQSVQIEINRSLYMNEITRETTASFSQVKSVVNRMLLAVAQLAAAEIQIN